MLLKCSFNPLHPCGVEEGCNRDIKWLLSLQLLLLQFFAHAHAVLMQQYLGGSCNVLMQVL